MKPRIKANYRRFRLIVVAMSLAASGVSSAETLIDVVKHTIVTNPQLMAAKANEDINFHAVRESEGELLPQVSATVNTGRERTTSVAQRLSTDQAAITLDRCESRISLTQLLFSGGRVFKTVRARGFDYKSAKFRTHSVREILILETAETYLDVMKYRQLVAIAKTNVRVHRDTLNKARVKFKAGAGRRVDVELGISRLSKAGAQLEAFIGDLQQAVSRYSAITALIPTQQMVMPSQPSKWLPSTLRIAINIAIERNPSLQVANAEFLANDARVGVARAAFWPTVSAEASATDNVNLDGIAGPNRDNNVSVVARYDIYRGGSDLAAYRLSKAERLRSFRESQQVRREIIEEVRISWATLMAARAEIGKLLVHVKSTGNVVADYRKQFAIGARPLFNVLDAENDYFNAKVALITSKFNAATAYYLILQNTGRITSVLLAGMRD